MLHRGHRFVPKKRGDGVTKNQYFESSGKKPQTGDDRVPTKYPWQKKAATVAGARALVKQAWRLSEEDRGNLFDHVHKLHPDILLSRRRL